MQCTNFRSLFKVQSNNFIKIVISLCDALQDLVLFLRFKKREKPHRGAKDVAG